MLLEDQCDRFVLVDSVQVTGSGLIGSLHGELLKVDVVRDDVVRVKISRGGSFDESPTFAVAVDPLAAPAEFSFEPGEDVVRLRTSALVVSVWLDPFRLDVHRTDGTVVVESARDELGRYWAYATCDDAFMVRRRCAAADAVFGLGQKTGPANRRGRSFTLWNTDVADPAASGDATLAENLSVHFDPYYISIPFFYHQARPSGSMVGSFVDNGYRATYDFSADDQLSFRFEGGQYTEYIFAGPQLRDILQRYVDLTGHMSTPPLWALGYHQCRWFGYTQSSLSALGRRLREERIPCDALWLDIDHMDGYRVFTWSPERFPDPRAMLDRLAEEGFRVVSIVDPGVKHDPGYWVYDQAHERGLLCLAEGGDTYIGQVWPGETAFPDFVRKEVRAWWGQLNAAHVASGLAGIWNDMNEPATGTVDPHGMRFGHGEIPHARFHNQYALLMAMGTTAGLLDAMPDRRTFVLSRAGSAGIQRYAANWLGDNASRWDHLWMSLPMATGLGISGQPFVGADMGGFFGDADPELLIRWAQCATLTPFCRMHSVAGSIDQYPWSFGAEVADHVRAAIRLRYRLLPYLYASFLDACRTGAPVQRPLLFDHQADPAAADVDDEFLLGRDLLVAPVLEPGAVSRPVYLPAGGWYDWRTSDLVPGGSSVTAAAPLERIPMYARAGAVIPMWTEAPASTSGYHPGVVELHVFVPDRDGTTTSLLQEDDGLTFGERAGACYRTSIDVTRVGGLVSVRGAVEGSGYPEFARSQFHVHLHGASPGSVLVDGVEQSTDAVVVVPNSGTAFVVEFSLG